MKMSLVSVRKLLPTLLFAGLFLIDAQYNVAQDIPGIPSGGPVTYAKPSDFTLGSTSPNELDGYRFLTIGSMADLKLGISSKEDVRNKIGATCRETSSYDICDYDSKWRVFVRYFDTRGTIGTTSYEQGRSVTREYVPLSQYLGKVQAITFYPKQRISFSQVVFSEKFPCGAQWQSAEVPNEIRTHYAKFTCRDSYGLTYNVSGKVVLHDKTLFDIENRIFERIESIEYGIPHDVEKKLFFSVKEK